MYVVMILEIGHARASRQFQTNKNSHFQGLGFIISCHSVAIIIVILFFFCRRRRHRFQCSRSPRRPPVSFRSVGTMFIFTIQHF